MVTYISESQAPCSLLIFRDFITQNIVSKVERIYVRYYLSTNIMSCLLVAMDLSVTIGALQFDLWMSVSDITTTCYIK